MDPELVQQIEVGAIARREARIARGISASLRADLACLRAKAASPSADRTRRGPLPLLTIAESLIAAHVVAATEGDGMTIDVIQDALHHVGKRLVRETNAEGRSASTILGHYRREHDGGPDRCSPLPE